MGGEMQKAKRKRLEKAGWRVGSSTEFLDLAPEESALIEMRLALGASLKARRLKQGLSQKALASRLASSQSWVAKMEAGDPSVSLDLLIRALLDTGAAPRDIARAISA
jgi:ribosome-binding protein aMBF1 (putative translation factor)